MKCTAGFRCRRATTTNSRVNRCGSLIRRNVRLFPYKANARFGTKLTPMPSATRLMIKSKLSSCIMGVTSHCSREIHFRKRCPVFDDSLIRSQCCSCIHVRTVLAFIVRRRDIARKNQCERVLEAVRDFQRLRQPSRRANNADVQLVIFQRA